MPIILITGGARSGKSSFAQSLFDGTQQVLYIATAEVSDAEMGERVRLHRAARPAGWRTAERYRDLAGALEGEDGCLLDCVTVLTSNIMFEHTAQYERIPAEVAREVERDVCDELKRLIGAAKGRGMTLALVTNELGSGIVPEHHVARVFRDIAGRVNQYLAHEADSVYLCVSGIPVKIK